MCFTNVLFLSAKAPNTTFGVYNNKKIKAKCYIWLSTQTEFYGL
jgi:hypothetical protein